jgi:hypothetical protein
MNAAQKIGEFHAVSDCAGMGCTVLALCAAAGRSRNEIENLLQRLVFGISLQLRQHHEIISNDTIQPPIFAFMEEHSYTGLMLVVARPTRPRDVVCSHFVDFVHAR